MCVYHAKRERGRKAQSAFKQRFARPRARPNSHTHVELVMPNLAPLPGVMWVGAKACRFEVGGAGIIMMMCLVYVPSCLSINFPVNSLPVQTEC